MPKRLISMEKLEKRMEEVDKAIDNLGLWALKSIPDNNLPLLVGTPFLKNLSPKNWAFYEKRLKGKKVCTIK
jgi:hypothetical protein